MDENSQESTVCETASIDVVEPVTEDQLKNYKVRKRVMSQCMGPNGIPISEAKLKAAHDEYEANKPLYKKKKGAGETCIDYFNRENKRSLHYLLPEIMRVNLDDIEFKKMVLLEEQEIRDLVKPSAACNRIRYNFWNLYDDVQDRRLPGIPALKIYRGVCALQQFEKYCKMPYIAWILKPPAKYEEFVKEALATGFERLREILALPFYFKTQEGETKLDYKVANLLLRTTIYLDMRVNGGILSRIDQRMQSEQKHLIMAIPNNKGLGDMQRNLTTAQRAKLLDLDNIERANQALLEELRQKPSHKLTNDYTRTEDPETQAPRTAIKLSEESYREALEEELAEELITTDGIR